MAKDYKYFLLAGLSGFTLALGHPGWNFDFGFLVWIGFIPLIFALKARQDNRKPKHFFLIGFAAGLVYFLIVFRWFWSFYPLDMVGLGRVSSATILLPVYAITSAVTAMFWGVFGLALGYLGQKASKQTRAWGWLVGPAVFVFLEYARAAGYGLLWLGSGTLFGSHWTMGNLAYNLAGNSLMLRLSSFAGIYGITFLVVAVNLLIFKILKSKNEKTAAAIVVTLVLLLTLVPKFLHQPRNTAERKINFAIIQTDTPTKVLPEPKEALAAFKEQLALLTKVAKERPESQVVVFPEASDFFKDIASILSGKQAETYFTNLFKEPRLIISGARIQEPDGSARSRVFSLNTKKDVIGYYDKQLLAPGGEFLPYPLKLMANIFFKFTASRFKEVRELQPGDKKTSTVSFDGFKAAPIICSELLSPGLTRSIAAGSDILTGMASYGMFHGKNTFQKQNLAAVRFRAAENNKPIIVAANMGKSFVVDNQGKVQLLASDKTSQILTGSIVLGSQKTWYNKAGDMPVFLASLLLIISFGLLTRSRIGKEA